MIIFLKILSCDACRSKRRDQVALRRANLPKFRGMQPIGAHFFG